MKIKKLVLFIICVVLPAYSQSAPTENFKTFLNKFFSDSKYQTSRVVFPFHERSSYIDPQTENPVFKDTVTFESEKEWQHITSNAGEKGATYTTYTDELGNGKKNASSVFRLLEFNKKDTDFNLKLVFKLINSKWYLIRKEYFEP